MDVLPVCSCNDMTKLFLCANFIFLHLSVSFVSMAKVFKKSFLKNIFVILQVKNVVVLNFAN